jgi:hypothetical protein
MSDDRLVRRSELVDRRLAGGALILSIAAIVLLLVFAVSLWFRLSHIESTVDAIEAGFTSPPDTQTYEPTKPTSYVLLEDPTPVSRFQTEAECAVGLKEKTTQDPTHEYFCVPDYGDPVPPKQ